MAETAGGACAAGLFRNAQPFSPADDNDNDNDGGGRAGAQAAGAAAGARSSLGGSLLSSRSSLGRARRTEAEVSGAVDAFEVDGAVAVLGVDGLRLVLARLGSARQAARAARVSRAWRALVASCDSTLWRRLAQSDLRRKAAALLLPRERGEKERGRGGERRSCL